MTAPVNGTNRSRLEQLEQKSAFPVAPLQFLYGVEQLEWSALRKRTELERPEVDNPTPPHAPSRTGSRMAQANVSSSPSSTFAPSVFCRDAKAEGVTKAGFLTAMNNLFAEGRIVNEAFGRASKTRHRIALKRDNEGASD